MCCEPGVMLRTMTNREDEPLTPPARRDRDAAERIASGQGARGVDPLTRPPPLLHPRPSPPAQSRRRTPNKAKTRRLINQVDEPQPTRQGHSQPTDGPTAISNYSMLTPPPAAVTRATSATLQSPCQLCEWMAARYFSQEVNRVGVACGPAPYKVRRPAWSTRRSTLRARRRRWSLGA